MKGRLLRYWTYLRRGHQTYLVFLMSFANFIVIQYRLLVEYVPALRYVFGSLLAFAAAFFLVYVPLAVVIGWLDYKKLAVPVDTALLARSNPYARAIARALLVMAEELPPEKREEVRSVLEPWAG